MEKGQYRKALEQFLAAINREAEDEQSGARDPQINYFVASGYEAIGNDEMAKMAFEKSARQELKSTGLMNYYQALSYKKLGETEKATTIFNALIDEGNQMLTTTAETDFFAKFGEKESENVQLSNAWFLKGLGNKGLGNTEEATKNLKKAVELSASNLWAKIEL